MASSDVQRKLTAIFCTDVVGYSRLMGDDPEGTLQTLIEYRKAFADKIQEYRGRVVNAPGDSILADFSSVVDAVSCAVDIQRELAARNQELPDHRRMDFRIGVNLGDVLVKEGALYGDGVNVAARLESLAQAGGICISRSVYDQVKSRLKLEYEYLGEQAVKNIAEPVRAYRVGSDSGEIAGAEPPATKAATPGVATGASLSQETKGGASSRIPAIAVLPFANMSNDPEQGYFSDGITEDLITDLSKISRMSVTARNTAFTYKGKAVKAREVGRELGVDYMLEGSVRKAGSRVRITAQLIDTGTGGQLWAERYDREFRDIFDLQDEITRQIVTALDVTLLDGEQANVWRKTTQNPEAYDLFLKGKDCYRTTLNLKGCAKAQIYYEQAIALDPNFTRAIVALAFMHLYEGRFGLTQSPEASLEKGFQLAKKAVALDQSLADAYSAIGLYHLLNNQHDRALAEAERAVALAPGSAEVVAHLAGMQNYVGQPAMAIDTIKEAMVLAPSYPAFFKRILGEAYLLMARYDEALNILKESLQGASDSLFTHARLAATYAALNRGQDAENEVREVLRIEPDFKLAKWASRALPLKSEEDLERMLKLLRKAGLPE